MINTEVENLVKVITATISDTKQFVLDQAPELAQQVILRGRVTDTFWTLFFMLLTTVMARFSINNWEKFRVAKEYSDDKGFYLAFGILTAVVAIFSLVGFGVNVGDCITSWVTPKIYLLEYLKSLLSYRKCG